MMKRRELLISAILAIAASSAGAQGTQLSEMFNALKQIQQEVEGANTRTSDPQTPTAKSALLASAAPRDTKACKTALMRILPSPKDMSDQSWNRLYAKEIAFTSQDALMQYINKRKVAFCNAVYDSYFRSDCFVSRAEERDISIRNNGGGAASNAIRDLAQRRCLATNVDHWINLDPPRYDTFIKIVENNATQKAEAKAAASRVKQARTIERDFDFKGIRLGDPLQAFVADKEKYICKTYTNEIAKCELRYVKSCEFSELPSVVQEAYARHGVNASGRGMKSCRTYTENSLWATVAGVPTYPESGSLHFLDGKLIHLYVPFYPKSIDVVYAAVVEKYGKPPDKYMRWLAKGKTLSLNRGDSRSTFELYSNGKLEIWKRKHEAKQKAERDAEIVEAKRKRQTDIRRRSKDL